jgi:hypothetical protein
VSPIPVYYPDLEEKNGSGTVFRQER